MRTICTIILLCTVCSSCTSKHIKEEAGTQTTNKDAIIVHQKADTIIPKKIIDTIKLEKHLGKTVKLRGRAVSLNGYWWFNYRGRDMYVEKMEQLPNWAVENHFRAMEITGTLQQALLPKLDQIAIKEKRDKQLYYIIRKASWEPIDDSLVPDDRLMENQRE